MPTAPANPAIESSSNLTVVPTVAPPLNEVVQSCNLATHVMVFAFAAPTPDLTGKTLTVDVQGQPSQCSSPSGMPGMLSCKIAPNTSFPAGIVVKVNGQVVQLFPFSGELCYATLP